MHNNDIDDYLLAQKNKLQSDKTRLNKNNQIKSESEITDIQIEKNNTKISVEENPKNLQDEKICIDDNKNDENLAKKLPNSSLSSPIVVNPYDFFDNLVKSQSIDDDDNDNHKMLKDQQDEEEISIKSSILTKADKDIANGNKLDKIQTVKLKNENKNDKDQWISDVFYSYFPSFNNEKTKKNENLLNEQKNDYQNYLKQIDNETSRNKHNNNNLNNTPSSSVLTSPSRKMTDNTITVKNSKENTNNNTNNNNNRLTSRSDKTEIELIVNNPDFKLTHNNKSKIRPSSNRDKLLHDLEHTGLSNMVYSNAIQERNLQITEREAQKKKEYQKELMRQIEEKRKEIQILKEKEKREEELLTRKLEQQLHAMQLEKDLENKRLNLEKQLQRETQNNYSINNLENRQLKSENDKENQNYDNNKVYKYFSNSARYDNYHSSGRNNTINDENIKYNQQQQQQPQHHQQQQYLGDTLESLNSQDLLLNSYFNHNNDYGGSIPLQSSSSSILSNYKRNLCSYCGNAKRLQQNYYLNYDDDNKNPTWCLNCYGKHYQQQKEQQNINELHYHNNNDDEENTINCEHYKLNQFLNNIICYDCEKLITCNYCNCKRNLCNNCIINYCINCGKSILKQQQQHQFQQQKISTEFPATAASVAAAAETITTTRSNNSSSLSINTTTIPTSTITTTTTTNSSSHNRKKLKKDGDNLQKFTKKQDLTIIGGTTTEKSFQILEINYPDDDDNADNADNDNDDVKQHQQYKKNEKIKYNNTENSHNKSYDDQILLNKKIWITDDNDDINNIKIKTNNQLTKYLNNYGDLAYIDRNRSRSNSTGSNRSKQSILTKNSQILKIKQQQQQHKDKNHTTTLSMPLLKDNSNKKSKILTKHNLTPKTKDIISNKSPNERRNGDQMLMVSQKWEIPAVQKQKISKESPRVLTQLGAIRKQLQMENYNLE